MLRFNTFRSNRYLRSKFVEGKYLLSSEGTDLELEMLNVLRDITQKTIGDVAIADSWEVQKLSDTQLLIKPGEAFFKGLPFTMRSGKDQLVSGAVLSAGVMPVGVSLSDDATGLGKVLTFNDGDTTPTNLYKIVITAREELITDVEDPFLQNANLTESTAQKIRLRFQINLVPDSLQTETPTPYRDESSTDLVATNFPTAGAFAAPNLVNQIVVTPAAALNGELIGLQLITGSEKIDGRDVEIVLRNDSALGGGHPIPKSPIEQSAFENGKLIDSNGNKYHINAIFNDVVSTQVVIRLDKEPNQPNPEIVNTMPFTLVKRDVYATDGVNGQPQGKLFWNIATVDWHSSNFIVHESKIVDLRTSVSNLRDYEVFINNKQGLRLTDGGDISWDLSTEMLDWSAALSLINPHGSDMSIALASIPLVEGGAIAYDLDMSGGAIEKGSLAVNITAFGANSTLDPMALDEVKVGNIVVDSLGIVAEITAINDINNVISTSPALTANGAATIYYDSFGPGKVPLTKEKYILAVRKNDKAYLSGLELEDGETSQVGDGASAQLLTFIGSTGDSDNSPVYSSNFYITNGDSLVTAIGALDTALDSLNTSVSALSSESNQDRSLKLIEGGTWEYNENPAVDFAAISYTDVAGGIDGGGAVHNSGSTTSSAFEMILASNETLTQIQMEFRKFIGTTGNVFMVLTSSTGTIPDTIITTSSAVDASTIGATNQIVTFNFAPTPLVAGEYFVYLASSGGSLAFSADNYANNPPNKRTLTTDGGATWSGPTNTKSPYLEMFVQGVQQNILTFDSDAYIQIPGLLKERNTIPISESPIIIEDGQVAYVELTRLGGPPANLTISVDNEDDVVATENTLIIARKVSNGVIVGSSSTKIAPGESIALYDTKSDQDKDKMRGADYGYFRSDQKITWTGTELQLLDDIVFETINRNGTLQLYTVEVSNSPIALANGEYLYLIIDRTQNSQTLTFTKSATIPTIPTAGLDLVIFAKRIDSLGKEYLHLPLSKQVIEPKKKVLIGASGGGGFDIDVEITLDNNQITPKDIDDLIVANNDNKAFKVEYSIIRIYDPGDGERITQGSFSGLYRDASSDWELGGFTSTGDASGVDFEITSLGQLQYTSDLMSGTELESKLKAKLVLL
jgi:hypothetical protein